MSEQIIKINIEQFKNEYNNITDIPENILDKVTDIKIKINIINLNLKLGFI